MIYNHRLYQEDLDLLMQMNIKWKGIRGKSILITGASGMIGTFLVDTFMKRNELYDDSVVVYALSRNIKKLKEKFSHYMGNKYLKLIEQDISKGLYLENYNFDYAIHAASNTHPMEYSNDPVGTITTNVFGAYYLLEYARLHKNCRIILLSSVEVYGENRGDVTYFDEDYCGYINCNTLRAGYPESKRLIESMLQAYIAQYQVNGISIRLCRIYGPTIEADDSKAISQFIYRAVAEENIILKSEGKQIYSYTYVADAVQAILRCMLEGKSGEVYNVADSASDITLKDLAKDLAEISNVDVVYKIPGDNEQRGFSTATKALLSSEKVKRLGWYAVYSIQDGLHRTLSILKDESRNL